MSVCTVLANNLHHGLRWLSTSAARMSLAVQAGVRASLTDAATSLLYISQFCDAAISWNTDRINIDTDTDTEIDINIEIYVEIDIQARDQLQSSWQLDLLRAAGPSSPRLQCSVSRLRLAEEGVQRGGFCRLSDPSHEAGGAAAEMSSLIPELSVLGFAGKGA